MSLIPTLCKANKTLAAIGTVLLLLAALSVSSFALASTNGDAEIWGRVTECWEGSPRPVSHLRVYVLSVEENPSIISIIEKMDQLLPADNTEKFQEFGKAYDQLVAALKSLGQPKGLARTDTAGRFVIRHLKSKKKYLVLAIDWDRGDSDEIAYYRYLITRSLGPGTIDLEIYMGPGDQSECRHGK